MKGEREGGRMRERKGSRGRKTDEEGGIKG